MPRAWLYGRHSSAKQDLTEDIQQDICEKFFADKLEPMGVTLVDWFYDPAVSSVNPFSERDQGRVVFVSAQPGDHIVCAKWSRAFRSLADGTKTLEQLRYRGVTFHACDLQADETRANGRLVRNLQMSVDQYQREIAAEAQNEIMHWRMGQGVPYSRGCPLGWRAVGVKPHRVFHADPMERALCTFMSNLRKSGMAVERIALWAVNQKVIPAKRRLDHVDAVLWALLAHQKGYPKISGFKRLRSMAKLGQV
jgi:DNA invertase Pin-like site-specific DNA recombinase